MNQNIEDHMNRLLSERLYVLRRKANMKQSDLARELNISQQAYSKLEVGSTRFSDHTIEILCKCFRMSREEFMNLGEENFSQTSGSPDHPKNSSSQTVSGLVALLLEELGKVREDRKMLVDFIAKQTVEHKNERSLFLNYIRELSTKKYDLP